MTTTDAQAWVVHKFGGSSVADARCFERVAAIVESQTAPAPAGDPQRASAPGDRAVGLQRRHRRTAGAGVAGGGAAGRTGASAWGNCAIAMPASPPHCSTPPTPRNTWPQFDRDVADLTGVLQTTSIMRSAAQTVRDLCAGLRRDLVDAAVSSLSAAARRARRACNGWTRGAASRWSGGRSARRCSGRNPKLQLAGAAAGPGARHAGDHRLHRQRPARRSDHARSQRQRFLRLDLRCAAGCGRDPHLDRRRRRAVGRSAPRARRAGDRFAVLQRGHGAGVLRRQGDPPADHGAGGGARHPDLDPQHLCARQARHADLRRSRTRACRSRASPASRT